MVINLLMCADEVHSACSSWYAVEYTVCLYQIPMYKNANLIGYEVVLVLLLR